MPEERISIIIEESGSRVVQRNLRDLGTAAKEGENGVNLLRNTLATLGIGASLASTISTMSQFGDAMAHLQVASLATGTSMDRLRDAAKRMGTDTEFSAMEVAAGFTLLTKSGFIVDQQLRSMKSAMDLAQVGSMDLGTAVYTMTAAMGGFRLGADQAGRVVDVLSMAASRSTADIGTLAFAMKYVGPIASNMGMSFEETTAALTVLAKAGIEARMAGSSLTQMMSALERPTDATRSALANLGISASQVKISSVGLAQALTVLKSAGMSAQQAMELFGFMGDRTFSILANGLPVLKQTTTEMQNSGGFAAKAAAIMDDTLGQAFKRLRASVTAVQVAFGELGSSSVLTGIVNGLTVAIRFLADHVEILDGVLIMLTIGSLPRAIGLLRTLGVTVLGSWPLLLGAAVGALYAFRNEIKLTSDSATTLGDIGSAALEKLQSAGRGVLNFFMREFSGVDTTFVTSVLTIKNFVLFTARGFDALAGSCRGIVNAIVAFFRGLGPAILDLLIQAMNSLIHAVETAVDGILALFKTMGQTIHSIVLGVTQSFDALAMASGAAISGQFGAAKQMADNAAEIFEGRMKTAFTNIPGRIASNFEEASKTDLIPRLTNVAEGAADKLGASMAVGFDKGFDQIGPFWEDRVNSMFDRADQIAANRLAKERTQAAGQGLPGAPAPGAAPTPTETPAQKLSTLNANVESGLHKIGETVHNYGTQIETTMVNAFSSAEDALVSFTTTGKINFKGMIDGMLGDLTRLLFRMALNNIFPASGSLFGGGKAAGGDVTPGTFYPVGEKGPEIWTPTAPGQVISNDRIAEAVGSRAQQEPVRPIVNVYTVRSEEEVYAAMRTRKGTTIIAGVGK
jgi:TP901 family phage tail tape measure protein